MAYEPRPKELSKGLASPFEAPCCEPFHVVDRARTEAETPYRVPVVSRQDVLGREVPRDH